MKIHLVDGTYELFRAHFGAPPKKSKSGQEVGATLGMIRSMLLLLSDPEVTHVAVAFDHVIESFRNKMYKGYKSSEGVDPVILNQFPVAEAAIKALGLVTWPMVKYEADDAIATAVAKFKKVKSVEQIVICSVDKDLTQMVDGDRVICWDRRREILLNEKGVIEKFGVSPESIPDFLALVGDSADGYPGIQGWGEKSTSAVLAKYKHIEAIPEDPNKIPLGLGRATTLLENLQSNYKDALLFRELSTLRTDVPLKETLADLKWQGVYPRFKKVCEDLGNQSIPERISKWRK
ncbi:MAG TPA: 5'-3' exonuclease H3TH domain-containing protein [Anaerolineales bacterium]|nr:5'-3' exonuclease H3TH domain-containing protein [Anaerolineales bacterium]